MHTKVLFCDGNHDNHWELRALKNLAVSDNVFYQPRGSTITLPDGRNFLFMGGANSIDKYRRTVGVSWCPRKLFLKVISKTYQRRISTCLSPTLARMKFMTTSFSITWVVNTHREKTLTHLITHYHLSGKCTNHPSGSLDISTSIQVELRGNSMASTIVSAGW